MFGREVEQEAEIVAYEPPHELRLALGDHGMRWERDYIIDAMAGGGSRVMLIFRSKAETGIGRTMQPLMSPMMQIVLRDELEQDLADIAAAVSSSVGHPTEPRQ